MSIRRLHSGFTLIETLVALVILSVVLGASVVASRTLANQAQQGADQAQMASLADESLANVRLFQQSYSSSGAGNLGSLFGITAGSTSPVTIKGVFYVPGGTNPAGTNLESQGPAVLTWCKVTDPCGTMLSPISDGPAGNRKIQQVANASGGELIAVRRGNVSTSSDYSSCTPDSPSQLHRQVVDLSNPLQSQSLGTCMVASGALAKDWDFYVRTISITRDPYCASNTDCGLYNGANPAGVNKVLSNATYRVTVTVRNYLHPGSSITRSSILTDSAPSKLITN